ncbi:MAG TPA: flagellar biosynthesis anti-sigma factor FlgM [Ktedonobacteraceae bacterium]|nr:flagellar biosynthesis anti-sigma factor FlgM [Ktedonobacteraceae bacterium]
MPARGQAEPRADVYTATIAQLQAQWLPRFDADERMARVETLKEQVQAESYQVDTQTLARQMQEQRSTQDILGIGEHDIFAEGE